MQHFKDSATGQIYAYDDDVVVINETEGVTLTTASGVPISAPATLQPYSPPADDSVAIAKSVQLAVISAACAAASIFIGRAISPILAGFAPLFVLFFWRVKG